MTDYGPLVDPLSLEEPVLYQASAPPGLGVARFLWLVLHKLVAVRLTVAGSACTVVTSVLESHYLTPIERAGEVTSSARVAFGPFVPARLSRDRPVNLRRSGQRYPQHRHPPGSIGSAGSRLDGAKWVFEFLDATGSRVAVRLIQPPPSGQRASGCSVWVGYPL